MGSTQKKIKFLAALSLLEGIATFVWLLYIPTNHQTYSVFRIAALLAVLLISAGFAVILYYIQTQKTKSSKLAGQIQNFEPSVSIAFFLFVIAFALWLAMLFRAAWFSFISELTYIRLLPIVTYGVLLCLQTGTLLILNHGISRTSVAEFKSIAKPGLILSGAFIVLWLFVWVSHLGFFFDNVGLNWGPPGTPITFAQVVLVFSISFVLSFGWHLLRSRFDHLSSFPFSTRDVIAFLALWGIAVIAWSNQPMSPTHFAPPAMSPNNEIYPNSDALIFDRSAYHLLYGIGFSNHLIRRPLYAGMLALFHEIAGTNYERTIFLQILVLALIPSVLYLLTSKLSNRMAGLLAGGLILLREKNSIALSGVILTSHAKLMMSDMISTLGVILFLYTTVKWFLDEKPSDWQAAVIGACLGLTALIRPQVLILVPVLLLFLLLSQKPRAAGFRAAIFALLGILLVMLPWVWRNWNLTGTFVLDDQGEARLLARDYSLTPYSLPPQTEGETDKEFSNRLKSEIVTFIRTNPKDVLFFVSNHFFRNLETSAVYLTPVYSADSPSSLIERLPFWNDWQGKLTAGSSIALLINLVLVAFGICLATTKNKYAGVFLVAAFLAYAFGNALVRSSGWRFNQPADWIPVVYYSIALAYLPSKISDLFPENISRQTANKQKSISISPAWILLLLVLLGASVPIAERIIPGTGYKNFSEDARSNLSNGQYMSSTELNAFLAQKDAVLLSGVALYPRYIRPGKRIYLADAPSGYRYLHFWLMNENDSQVVLPLQSVPHGIPHTVIVSILGCQEQNYISAFAVIVQEPQKQVIFRDPIVPLHCPLPEPEKEQ